MPPLSEYIHPHHVFDDKKLVTGCSETAVLRFLTGNNPATPRELSLYINFHSPLNSSKRVKKEGIICLKRFVLISSVGKPLNTVLSWQRIMGKATDFPCRAILHSPP